uniref:Uncharacterized protein ycf68 n=1 Tax=Solanum lycopersicum TaxID=4081 RepID=K4D8D2_SOLLC
MTSRHHALYAQGDTRATMTETKGRDPAREDRCGNSVEIQCREGGPSRLLSSREFIHPLSAYGHLSLEHRFRFNLNRKIKLST